MTFGKASHFLKLALGAGLALLFLACLLYACASVGTPQGGPIDEAPPRFVTSTPLPNSLRYNKQKIEIEFDELITVDNPMDKVIITPPQMQFPVVKALGKKLVVEIKDSLQPNTTYTIDFSDAITDNNEKNVLENFSFAFSTGDVVDSLVVSGVVLHAANLEPAQGVLVGLHKNLADSAFTTLPFFRTSKTNERGQFWIRNVAPGTYRVFALNDMDRDYKFGQPGEEIAFFDSLVVPSFVPAVRMDTLWKDSLTIDTIKEVRYNRFVPDDVNLFLFKEKFSRQYLRKYERSLPHLLSFTFNAVLDTLPKLLFLDEDIPASSALVTELAEGGTVLQYWLTDSVWYKKDTLNLSINYYKTDETMSLVQSTDTVSLFMKKSPKKAKEKKKKDGEEEKIEFLPIVHNASSAIEVYDTLQLRFAEPLVEFDAKRVLLLQKIDSVLWDTLSFTTLVDKHNPKLFYLIKKWDYNKNYSLQIDSAAFTSVYGKWNNTLNASFSTKSDEVYGHLYVSVNGVEGEGIGELLDGSDKLVRRVLVKDGGLLFMNLKPATYYLRYIEDSNGNGEWDTGEYSVKRQAERVYYYPTGIEIPQNWEIEQNWKVDDLPISKQKPLEVTKNKPKEKIKPQHAQNRNTTTGRQNKTNSRFVP